MTPAAFHAALVAAVTARGQTAQAATPGPWLISDETGDLYTEWDATERDPEPPIVSGEPYRRADAAHIAANGPGRILRDVARDLDVLKRHAPRLYDDEPHWICSFCHTLWTECPELFSEHGLAAAYQITDEETT